MKQKLFFSSVVASFCVMCPSLFACADTTHNLNKVISKDQAASIVNYIVQATSLGITITNNISLAGTYNLNPSNRVTMVDLSNLSFDLLLDGKPITMPDSVRVRITADIKNGDCENLIITRQYVTSTDSLITESMKNFIFERADHLMQHYIIDATSLARYCINSSPATIEL